MLKINLGCGNNLLPGWENHDADVDISKPLPWADNTVDYILAEHVIEHIPQMDGVKFLFECHRVLNPGGVARIAVPDVDRILDKGSDSASYLAACIHYCQNDERFPHAPHEIIADNRRCVLHNIIANHYHKSIWTAEMLYICMLYAGLRPWIKSVGDSSIPELKNVEGHGAVISENHNWIETSIVEGKK